MLSLCCLCLLRRFLTPIIMQQICLEAIGRRAMGQPSRIRPPMAARDAGKRTKEPYCGCCMAERAVFAIRGSVSFPHWRGSTSLLVAKMRPMCAKRIRIYTDRGGGSRRGGSSRGNSRAALPHSLANFSVVHARLSTTTPLLPLKPAAICRRSLACELTRRRHRGCCCC